MKESHLKVYDGQNQKKDLNIPELLKVCRIRQVKEIFMYTLEAVRIQFQDEIEALDMSPVVFDDDEKVISLNRDEYYPKSTPEKLKHFFRIVLNNHTLQKIVMDDYEHVYLPLLSQLENQEFERLSQAN